MGATVNLEQTNLNEYYHEEKTVTLRRERGQIIIQGAYTYDDEIGLNFDELKRAITFLNGEDE